MWLSVTEVFSIDSTTRNTGKKAAAATSHNLDGSAFQFGYFTVTEK